MMIEYKMSVNYSVRNYKASSPVPSPPPTFANTTQIVGDAVVDARKVVGDKIDTFFDGKRAPSKSIPVDDTCQNIFKMGSTSGDKFYTRVKSTFGTSWKEFNSLDDAKRAYLNKKDIPLDTICFLGKKKSLTGNLRFGSQTETTEPDYDIQVWYDGKEGKDGWYRVKDGMFGRSLQRYSTLKEAEAAAKAAKGGARRKTRGRGRKTRGRKSRRS